MKKYIRFLLLMLACAMLVSTFAACAEKGKSDDSDATGSDGNVIGAESETEFVYEFAATDFQEGDEVTLLGLDYLWDMYIYLTADVTGDKLDSAVYKRNEKVANAMGISIFVDETQWEYDAQFVTYINKIQNAINTDMSNWDVIYLPINKRPDLITQGLFQDLSDIETIQLGRDWWDPTLNDVFEFSNRLYFASSSLQLQSFDSAWGIFFNEDLINSHEGMKDPRDLVNNNQWTMETLKEMCAQAANKNSSESFWWYDGTGDQVYGIAAHPNLPDKLLYATGERYVVKDSDGTPSYAAGGERFVNVVQDMASFLSYEGNLEASSEDMRQSSDGYIKGGGYVYAFANDRAYFIGAEIKTARVLKSNDIDISYGLVPLPKYDAAQQDYYTPIVETLLVMTVPATCTRSEDVGAVVDALSYYSYVDVLPVYYDQILYRGYNEEDAPMMDIINNSRGVDMGYFYGWNDTLAEQVRDRIFDGSADISGTLISEKEAIITAMRDWQEMFKKLGGS